MLKFYDLTKLIGVDEAPPKKVYLPRSRKATL